jgi:peptide/nickel transport system substrate-binding protein
MFLWRKPGWSKTWISISLVVLIALGVGCASTTTPNPGPTATDQIDATSVSEPGASTDTPTETIASTVLPITPESARDSLTLAVNSEPTQANIFLSLGGPAPMLNDNIVDPWTWHSGDDLRVVSTTATESWEQLAPDQWRFELRQGVKFHNGEDWNAQAAMPSLNFQGSLANSNVSSQNTGAFTAEVAGDYTVDITCANACPIFPKTSIFLDTQAPDFFTSSSEEELAQKAVSFGPYKLVQWDFGIAMTQEAFEDYVPAGDHFEFQKPSIPNVKWVWRGEYNVLAAMVDSGEADIAFDVGLDAGDILSKGEIKAGRTAEVASFWLDTIWHPELKKTRVRQAMAHAINCQELVDTLYRGIPPCIGNIIFPGVLGATERNTAPYEFDPALSRQLLEEANYDPQNVIRISGRPERIPKQIEIYEALHGYLTDVGMNVEINVIDNSNWGPLSRCRIGTAVREVMEARGKDPVNDEPTLADMQAAIDKGSANCPTVEMQETGGYSNETLDFQKVAVDALSCLRDRSFVCDPSPGGLQEQIAPALAATGEERQRLMQAMADRIHDEVLWLGLFDLPIFYAVDPKLDWEPRFDRRIRVNTMSFNP